MSIVLVMVSMLYMQLIAIANQPNGYQLRRVASIVECPDCTSYFTEALTVKNIGSFLQSFHLNQHVFHGQNKPPGPVLYYVLMLRLFNDPYHAALIGGILIGLLATFSIPATYFLVKSLINNQHAAFHAASYISLTPGLVLFFPEFDQIFPVFTCLIIGCWVLAIAKDSIAYSSLLGAITSIAFFMTWNPAVLAVFLMLYTICFLICSDGAGKLSLVLRHICVALALIVFVYFILWLVSGYHPIKALHTAIIRQNAIAPPDRIYPKTILFDLTDYLLGTGWPIVLLVMFIARKIRAKTHDNEWWVSIIGLVQIASVAIMHLLPAETARVWIFMFPLIALPVGLELSKFSNSVRVAVYASFWILTLSICQNMTFIRPSKLL